MINQYIQQLNSPDPAQRRAAIVALGKSNDAAALKPLADVYRNDPDPALRDLALKAGRYLRQQAQENAPAPAAAAPVRQTEPADNAKTADVSPSVLQRRTVSDYDSKRARDYVNDTLTHNIDGNNDRAIKSLRNAVKIDPNIVDEAFFISVAGTVTNLNGMEAVDFLLDQQKTTEFVRENVKQKRDTRISEHLETAKESSWGGVAWEATLYFLINVIAPIIFGLIFIEVIRNTLNDPNIIEELQLDRTTRNTLESLQTVGPALIFLYGLISGVSAVITIFLYGGVVHLAATTLFRGKGLYRNFLDQLLGLYNKRLPIYWILILVGNYLTLGAGAPLLGGCAGLIILIFTIWLILQQTSITSQAYDFGFAGGCLSHVIALILFVVLAVILQMILGAPMLNALNNLAAS